MRASDILNDLALLQVEYCDWGKQSNDMKVNFELAGFDEYNDHLNLSEWDLDNIKVIVHEGDKLTYILL